MEHMLANLAQTEMVWEPMYATYQNVNFGDDSNFRMDSKAKIDLEIMKKYFRKFI